MTPADAAGVDASIPPLLERQWQRVWDDGNPLPWSFDDAERGFLTEFLRAFHRGEATWTDVHDAALIMAKAFAAPPRLLAVDAGSEIEVELRAHGDERVLTDIPWEAAAAATRPYPAPGQPLLDYLAGRFALMRVSTTGRALDAPEPFRPNVLWCVSSPTGAERIDLAPFNNILRKTLDAYHYLRTTSFAQKFGAKPRWSDVKPTIEKQKPSIFILIAHGKSGDGGDEPRVLFQSPTAEIGDEEVSIRDLADVLATAGCWLTVLICCDLVRATAYSGALELVKRGIPEVVAMQGKINHKAAKSFLDAFVGNLLVRHSTPIAAAAGRSATRDHVHSCLPAVFGAAAQRARANPLAVIAPAYDAARTAMAPQALEYVPYFERAALEEKLLCALMKSGLLVIAGPPRSGATELVKACVRRAALPHDRSKPRPILYVDLRQQPPYEERISSFVSGIVFKMLDEHRVLLPKDTKISRITGPAELLQLVDEACITVVIDHLPLSIAKEPESLFWRELIAQTPLQCPNGLVCLMPDDFDLETIVGAAAGGLESFTVPTFDLAETTRYVEERMPGADAQRLYKDTGGKPAFLEAARQRWLNDPTPTALARIGIRQGRDEAAHQLLLLRRTLSLPATRRTIFEMACVNGAAAYDGVIEHIAGIDSENAVEELVRRGIISRAPLDANTAKNLVWMPAWTRDALLRYGRDIKSARRRIARRFTRLTGEARETTVAALVRTRGGSAILECIQQSLLDSGDTDAATDVALSADIDRARDSTVLALYEAVIPFTKDQDGRADPDLLLQALARAQNLGRDDRVRELFEQLEQQTEPDMRSLVLLRKIIWLKDTSQAAARQQIDAILKEALALTAAPPVGGPTPEEWTKRREEILLNSLQARLFLERERYATVPQEYRQLVTELSDPADKAVLLCTFAEQELRQPPGEMNGKQVAGWLTDANALLENSTDDRAITYCAYQYGQYLREIAKQETAAYAQFRIAEEAGRESDELRRWGLARLRRVEMLLVNPALENGIEDGTQHARRLLEEVLREMPASLGDALTARVVGRLSALRAAIATNDGDEHAFRDRAADAFAAPMLHSDSDNHFFISQATRLLAMALDDPVKGDFRYAQHFIRRFEKRLGDLGIPAELEAPERTLQALRQLFTDDMRKETSWARPEVGRG